MTDAELAEDTWTHRCPVEGDFEVGRGQYCNWCGAREFTNSEYYANQQHSASLEAVRRGKAKSLAKWILSGKYAQYLDSDERTMRDWTDWLTDKIMEAMK